jgi:hypothetical protein
VNAIRGGVLLILATSVAACILFTDTDGFSNGGAGASDAVATTDAPGDGTTGDARTIDASFDAPPDAPSFRDEFSRADDPNIGNGWTEKRDDAYSLAGGAVLKVQSPTHYRDNMVTRPAAEDRADVEVSAVFTLGGNLAHPQVFARARRSTLGNAAAYDGYMLFLAGLSRVSVARQRGDADEVTLATIDLPNELGMGTRVKLTLRVYDESPPVLEGLVDRIEGSGATRIGETKILDEAPERIDGPGAMGFSASYEGLPAIDDFEWRALGTR